MGSPALGSCLLLPLLGAAGLLAQTPAVVVPPFLPEVVLAAAHDGRAELSEFGLGDGGIARTEPGELRWRQRARDCITAGGVRVECRAAGVKVTFASGCELLVAPDGCLHLRGGEVAGPFARGVELRLGDGTLVRITLAPDERERVRDVVLVDGEVTMQPWRRGAPAAEVPRAGSWAGPRLACLGDGGDLYRPIALGPLVVLERVLASAAREPLAPRQRLVVLVSPLVQSLVTMCRQHREPEAAVRQAVTAVAAVADRGDAIFQAGAALPRAEHDRLRWLLRGGFELQIELAGAHAPRLQLFAGKSPLPMIEWTLRAEAAAFLTNPRADQSERRWHGNGTRLPRVASDLQAREHLFERGQAIAVLERMQRATPAR